MKKMRHGQETPVERTILHTTETSTSNSKGISKKREHGLCIKQRPRRKHLPTQSNQLHWTNHANLIKQSRTIEYSIGFQYDPAGHGTNLSHKILQKTYTKF